MQLLSGACVCVCVCVPALVQFLVVFQYKQIAPSMCSIKYDMFHRSASDLLQVLSRYIRINVVNRLSNA